MSPRERFAAWFVTGPPGHLWSALADLAVAWVRYFGERVSAWRRGAR